MHQGRQTTHFEIENHLTYFLPIREGISALQLHKFDSRAKVLVVGDGEKWREFSAYGLEQFVNIS